MSRIAAVVVTYNRIELLKENIQCLLNQNNADLDILIVDNASTDGTREQLEPYIESQQIIYYNTGSNLGGAGGFNAGIRRATEMGYDYLWIMDDDCMPKADALAQFMKADRELNGSYGFLSSKVLWKDETICTMNVQRRKLTKYVKDFSPQMIPVAMASFVSLFMKREVVMELGLPIKEFFIWTDDWEYTRRISQKYPCYVVTDSVVVHKSQNNVGANIATDDYGRLDRYKYLYRNDVYLYRREGLHGFCYEIVRLSGHVVRVLLKAKDHKLQRIGKIIQGTKEGFKFHPPIEMIENDG